MPFSNGSRYSQVSELAWRRAFKAPARNRFARSNPCEGATLPTSAAKTSTARQARLSDQVSGILQLESSLAPLFAFEPVAQRIIDSKQEELYATPDRMVRQLLPVEIFPDRTSSHSAENAGLLPRLASGGLVGLQALDRPAFRNGPSLGRARCDQQDFNRTVVCGTGRQRSDLQASFLSSKGGWQEGDVRIKCLDKSPSRRDQQRNLKTMGLRTTEAAPGASLRKSR